MVHGEQNDDFVEAFHHLLFPANENLVAHDEHQVELADVHAQHQLCPGIVLELNYDECYS